MLLQCINQFRGHWHRAAYDDLCHRALMSPPLMVLAPRIPSVDWSCGASGDSALPGCQMPAVGPIANIWTLQAIQRAALRSVLESAESSVIFCLLASVLGHTVLGEIILNDLEGSHNG
jgi:hypothetical protein